MFVYMYLIIHPSLKSDVELTVLNLPADMITW